MIVRPGAGPLAPRVLGIGHHQRYGHEHAEVNALRHAAQRGLDVRGATAYVTLEPCAHTGKQPPCTGALINAGIARVVCARRDPNPLAAGGAEALRAQGVQVEFTSVSPRAARLTDPFVMNVTRRRPWVIAKWAQSIDGKIATRAGESQWISGERSRRRVHRLRARVDAVIVGVGTVIADDPLLTARGVAVRRAAMRVVIDPGVRTPPGARMLTSPALTHPSGGVIIAARPAAAPAEDQRRHAVLSAGATVWEFAADAARRLDLGSLLARLYAEHRASSVLVEGGPRTLGHFLEADLLDELHVYTGPLVMGDALALGAVSAAPLDRLRDARAFELVDVRRVDGDVRAVYRRPIPA